MTTACVLSLRPDSQSIVLYCMFIDCTGIVQNHSKYKKSYKYTKKYKRVKRTEHNNNIVDVSYGYLKVKEK